MSYIRHIVLLLFVLIGCDWKNTHVSEEHVLAQINELKVTERHFLSAFKRNYYKVGEALTPSIENKMSVLKNEFNTYVFAQYAKDIGLENDKESTKEYGLLTRKIYVEEYLNREVLNKVTVTERDLRELYLRFNTSLKASHLYAKDIINAENLYQRLMVGEAFEDLAKEAFQNTYLANNGGDIGEFTADELDIAFENVAFNLEVGQISKPVKTRQGYSIIKLTGRKTLPILTEYQYQSQKNNFIALAGKRLKEIETRKHIEKTISELNLDQNILENLWIELQSSNHYLRYNDENQTITIFEGIDDQTMLAAFNGFTFTVQDLKSEGYYTDASSLNKVNDFYSFFEFVKGLVYRSYLVHNFQNSAYSDDPVIQASLNQSFHSFLSTKVHRHIYDTINIYESELIQEYDSNKEMYDYPLMMNVGRIVVESKNKAEILLKELDGGMDWEYAVKKFTNINQDLMVDGVMGLQPIQNYGSYSYDLLEALEGDLVGPLLFSPNQYVVFKILEIQEPKDANFEEVKDLVIQITKKKKTELEKLKILTQTMKKHNAFVDEEKLALLTIEL